MAFDLISANSVAGGNGVFARLDNPHDDSYTNFRT